MLYVQYINHHEKINHLFSRNINSMAVNSWGLKGVVGCKNKTFPDNTSYIEKEAHNPCFTEKTHQGLRWRCTGHQHWQEYEL